MKSSTVNSYSLTPSLTLCPQLVFEEILVAFTLAGEGEADGVFVTHHHLLVLMVVLHSEQ